MITTNIRLELGIDAQRFIQQVQLSHGAIEEQIAQGIELALNDICQGDNLVEAIRESAKTEILKIVNQSVMGWEIQHRIEKLISEKIHLKVEEYADTIAEKVTAALGKQ